MITLDDAARHIRVDTDNTEHRFEVEYKLAEAIAIASAYVGRPVETLPYALMDPNDDPAELATARAAEAAAWQERGFDAAVLLILGELWACRESGTAAPLSPTVKNVLNLYRTPDYA